MSHVIHPYLYVKYFDDGAYTQINIVIKIFKKLNVDNLAIKEKKKDLFVFKKKLIF